MNINHESNMYNMLNVCISKVKTGENKIKEWKDYVKTAKKTFRALVKAAKVSEPEFPDYDEAYAFMLSEYERKKPDTCPTSRKGRDN